MEPIVAHPVVKEGTLGKLGGGAGGHKNWKDRYFVLTDFLNYYTSKAAYEKDPKAAHQGRVALNAYYVSKPSDEEADSLDFCVNAYPKSLTCRASSKADMEDWVRALLMAPLAELGTVHGGGGAAQGGAAVSTAVDAPTEGTE